ncbi:MAG: hypothetical protein FWH38_09450 [Treponema sp.]|nr:hypothetical protein [Treponema sp.]
MSSGKKKFAKIIPAIAGTLLAFYTGSCVSSVPVRQTAENISYPELGTVATKSIGDILLSQGVRTTYPAIEMLQNVSGPALVRGNIQKGIYIAVNQEGNKTIYKPANNDIIMNEAMGLLSLALSSEGLYIAGRNGFGMLVNMKKIEPYCYAETVTTIETSSDFQQTLIYTGREGNTVKAAYREFSGNSARTAFNIDATYDLNDSDIIAFRGAKLQIIEATNTTITYRVLSNFN